MKRAPKTRTQNPTVLLGPAYVWQCPLCGEINFDTPRHLRPRQYERLSDQIDAPEDHVYCNPCAVKCGACSKVFRSIAHPDGDLNIHIAHPDGDLNIHEVCDDVDDDDDDDSGINLIEDAGDWTDGEL